MWVGLILEVELVKDQQSKSPDLETTTAVIESARDHGLILSKSGTHRNVLRLVLPLCLGLDDVEPIVAAMDASFRGFS